MPAGLPGDSAANNGGDNPELGRPIIMDPLSGPKGSPLDNDADGNASTGAMCTGIGYGLNTDVIGPTAPASIDEAGFDDDQIPGTEHPGRAVQNVENSTLLYIGGGKTVLGASDENVAGEAGAVPYNQGVLILAAGNGGSRDAGAGPAFTGFGMKMVTAAADDIDIGDVVETGWVNRSERLINTGESVNGSTVAASGIPATV